MFKPQYRISNHFLTLAEKIAVISAKIDSVKVKLPQIAKLQIEAQERNTHSSTAIEGNTLTLAQVTALNQKADINADAKEKQEVLNYLNALRWIEKKGQLSLSKPNLLKLHAIITEKILGKQARGHFKTKQNYVINEKGIVVYTPPPPRQTPRLVDELIAWVNSNNNLHPIIVNAIFHHQLLNIHPFVDGNGRLARAAARWVLFKRGFDPYHIFALDDYFAKERKRYYEKIQQARDLDYDFTYWIDYVAEAVLDATSRVWQRLSRFSLSSKHEVVLTPKQDELIQALASEGILGSSALCKILKINRARVNQLIMPLVEAGIVERQGKARAVRYFIRRGR